MATVASIAATVAGVLTKDPAWAGPAGGALPLLYMASAKLLDKD